MSVPWLWLLEQIPPQLPWPAVTTWVGGHLCCRYICSYIWMTQKDSLVVAINQISRCVKTLSKHKMLIYVLRHVADSRHQHHHRFRSKQINHYSEAAGSIWCSESRRLGWFIQQRKHIFVSLLALCGGGHWWTRRVAGDWRHPLIRQGSWGQHGAHLGPTGPRWAPCWPHEPCYLGH